jgi:predicted transcriptional regulator
MSKALHAELTRRERQIMDALFRRGRASAAEIQGDLPGDPAYSTVRTQLRVLEEKGFVRHTVDGVRFVYEPAVSPQSARRSAVKHLIETFFGGSVEQAVAALLGGGGGARVSDEELDRIAKLIAEAKAPRRKGQ